MGKRGRQQRQSASPQRQRSDESTAPYTAPRASADASPPSSSLTRTLESRAALIGGIGLGIVALVFAIVSWGKTCHILIDYGREVYVPWRIVEGEVLYQDIAYFNGPLSPHWNAIWFGIFGVDMDTLRVVNLLILGGATTLLWQLCRTVANAWTCNLVGFAFLTIFGFGQIIHCGNFNWIEPYSHEMTHGVALSLLCVWFFFRWQNGGSQRTLLASGAALGLVFLTKPELALAAGAALGAGLLLRSLDRSQTRRLQPFMLLAGAAIVPPLLAFLLLLLTLPFGDALRGALGSWYYVFNEELRSLPFYKSVAGTDDAKGNLLVAVHFAIIWALWIGPLTVFSWLFKNRSVRTRVIATVIPMVLACLIILLAEVGEPLANLYSDLLLWGDSAEAIKKHTGAIATWPYMFRPLPIALALVLALWFRYWLRSSGEQKMVAGRAIVLTVLGLAFLAKIILAARTYSYGFGLGVVGVSIVILSLAHWLPTWIHRRSGAGWVLRGTMLVVIAIAIGTHIDRTRGALRLKAVPIKGEHETVYAHASFFMTQKGQPDQAGYMIRETVTRLQRQLHSDDTLCVLPEGVLINFLIRRRSSVPHINFMPPEMVMFGKDEIIESFKKSPPDHLLLVQRETHGDYGEPFAVYARDLFVWSAPLYKSIGIIGEPPLVPDRAKDLEFGLEFFGLKKPRRK